MDLLSNCTNSSLLSNCTNTTDQPLMSSDFYESDAVRWIRMVAYGLVFLFGVFGNLVVILAFRQPKMKTVPNLFISNLAIADGVVSLINVPLVALHGHISYWPYGEFLCKLLPFLQGVSLVASVGTMIVIAVDRYLVIVRYDLPKLTLIKARKWIAGIWLISCAIPSPMIYLCKIAMVPIKGEMRPRCYENWPNPMSVRAFTMSIFVVLYCIPLIVTCTLYGLIAKKFMNLPTAQKVSHQAQRRIIRMFMAVVFMFALCWFPYHVVYLYMDYSSNGATSLVISMVLFTQCLMFANSACNPIVYAVFNTNYRRAFINMARFRFGRDYSIDRNIQHGPSSKEAHRLALVNVEVIVGRTNSNPEAHRAVTESIENRRPTI